MTAQALSTLARNKVRAIVVVMDNGMYAIEQYLLDPDFFTDQSHAPLAAAVLNRWNYAEIARAMGIRLATTVDTVASLHGALQAAEGWDGPALISVEMQPRDLPPELRT